jgi:hypothetical protein
VGIAEGISIGKDAFGFLTFVKGIVGADVISGYYRWDGTLVDGSKDIKVEKHTTEIDSIFWLNVKPLQDYAFIRLPINGNGCEEIHGFVDENPLSDPSFWRWVSCARSGTIVSGGQDPVNAKVDFVVVGYRPKALIKYFSGGA